MSYNVFADMGFENPETELLKSEIVSSLRGLMEEKHLTTEIAAALWSMEPIAATELLRGHWGQYSVERLFQLADLLSRVPAAFSEEKMLALTA